MRTYNSIGQIRENPEEIKSKIDKLDTLKNFGGSSSKLSGKQLNFVIDSVLSEVSNPDSRFHNYNLSIVKKRNYFEIRYDIGSYSSPLGSIEKITPTDYIIKFKKEDVSGKNIEIAKSIKYLFYEKAIESRYYQNINEYIRKFNINSGPLDHLTKSSTLFKKSPENLIYQPVKILRNRKSSVEFNYSYNYYDLDRDYSEYNPHRYSYKTEDYSSTPVRHKKKYTYRKNLSQDYLTYFIDSNNSGSYGHHSKNYFRDNENNNSYTPCSSNYFRDNYNIYDAYNCDYRNYDKSSGYDEIRFH